MVDLSQKSPEAGKSKGLDLVLKCRHQQELLPRLVSGTTAETRLEMFVSKTRTTPVKIKLRSLQTPNRTENSRPGSLQNCLSLMLPQARGSLLQFLQGKRDVQTREMFAAIRDMVAF